MLGNVKLLNVKSWRDYVKRQKVFLLLLLLFLVIFTACGNEDKEDSLNENDDLEESIDQPIEEISLSIERVDYNKEDGYLEFEIDSSLPDETLIYLELKGANELNTYFTEGYVEDNKLIAKVEENDDNYIINDAYSVEAIVEANDDENMHLLDEYGDYEDFSKRYELTMMVDEISDGYLITVISDEEIVIDNAYDELEVDELIRSKKRETAISLEYDDLMHDSQSYEGEYVKYSGWIEQVIDFKEGEPDRLLISLRINDDLYSSIHNSSGNWISVTLPEDLYPEVFNGDESINLYGYVQGIHTYLSNQKEIRVPDIKFHDMDLHYSEEDFEGF